MEEFWGIVAWSYLEAPGNFNAKVNTECLAYRIVTGALFAVLMVDIVMTVAVMLRADARCHGVEATTPIETAFDTYYPNEVLQARFENMGGIGRPD